MLKDLHRRRKGAPFVVAEEGAAGSCGQDQVVVAVGLAVEDDLLAFGVDVGDFPQQHLNVVLLANQLAQGRCDVSTGHQTRGNLIEQRLKQVEVALINQRDAHIGIGQSLAGMHAGKSPADNHDMGGMAETFLGRFEFKKKMAASHGIGEGPVRRLWSGFRFVRAQRSVTSQQFERFKKQPVKEADSAHVQHLLEKC